MKLKEVRFKNFKSYPDKETKLNLDFDGVKLLVGSNGDGKSTFFDAVIWCLYGKNKDGVDGVVNRKTKKNCKVEVIFEKAGEEYSVIRYRNHEENGNKLLLFKGKKNISGRTTTDTQELINGLIEISYNTMVSSILLSSELYVSFLRASQSERLKIFESLLSLKEITLYYNKLKKMREPINENVITLEKDKIKAEVEIETLKKSIEEYKENSKAQLVSLKEEKKRLEDEIKDLENKINEYSNVNVDDELDKIKKYDLYKAKKNELEDKLNEIDDIIDITKFVSKYNKNKLELEKIKEIDVNKELNILDKEEEINKENSRLQSAIDKLKLKIRNTSSDNKDLNRLEKELNGIIKELEDLKGSEQTCPVCKQPIDKELNDRLIKEKEEEKNKIEEEIKKVSENIKNKEEENKKVEEAIETLESKIQSDIQTSSYERDYLISIQDRIVEIEQENELLKKDISNAEEMNKVTEKRIKEIKEELLKIKENIDIPEYREEFVLSIKEKIKEYTDEIKDIKEKINEINGKALTVYDKNYVSKKEEEIKKKEKEVKKIVNKYNKALVEQKHYDIMLEILSNKNSGFKKFFINKLISIFNDRINFYLPFFFDNDMRITFDKDLKETIMQDGEEVSFTSFSSGQKTRFDIAISFSLFMLAKTFFSTSINLLVFDEILDMNLDEKGFNSVYEIINNLGENNSVFVVSHQEFYKEKFKHSIQIKRDENGFSYIANEV